MKIDIKEKENISFYDELLYVTSYYKKIKINHKRKITKLSSEFTKYLILILVFMISTIALYIVFKDEFYIAPIIMYILLLIVDIYYIYSTKKRIKDFMNSKDDKVTININENYVQYSSVKSVYKINWEDIECILVNKYSICFIPKNGSSNIIGVSIKYRHKIVETIKKYNKSKLLVINNHEE